MTTAKDVRDQRRKATVGSALLGFSDEPVFAEIVKRRSGGAPADRRRVKHAELELLTAPGERLGEDRPGTTFLAEALPRERWDLPVMAPFERVLLVHRLREVTAAVGFTRFEPTAPDVDGELEIGARRASLSREADWLPAVENRGEGIFLRFAKAVMRQGFNAVRGVRRVRLS